MSTLLPENDRYDLLPLLGSISRLLRNNVDIEDDHLFTLLKTVNMHNSPHAFDELLTWKNLLVQYRHSPTETKRLITLESFLKRGVPEAPVILALSEVGRNGGDEVKVGNSVSPFNTFTNSQNQQTNCKLSARVTQAKLGKPAGLNPDFGNMAIVTVGHETLEIDTPLQISQSLAIVGSNPSLSILEGTSDHYALKLAVKGVLYLANLRIRIGRNHGADCIIAGKGTLVLQNCEIQSAPWDPSRRMGGDGVFLFGNAKAEILNCTFTSNQLCGLRAAGDSQVTISKSDFKNQGASGIYACERARVSVIECSCTENGYHGIHVDGEAFGSIRNNVCSDNLNCGIAFTQQACGQAEQNICTGNHREAIFTDTDCHVVLSNNTLNTTILSK